MRKQCTPVWWALGSSMVAVENYLFCYTSHRPTVGLEDLETYSASIKQVPFIGGSGENMWLSVILAK